MTLRNNAIKLMCLLMIVLSISCDHRKIVYSGFNDLVVGSQSLILYDDKTFYIEMGSGGMEGKYEINQDVISLKYYNKPSNNWPDIILINKEYFISKDSLDKNKYLKIVRIK